MSERSGGPLCDPKSIELLQESEDSGREGVEERAREGVRGVAGGESSRGSISG